LMKCDEKLNGDFFVSLKYVEVIKSVKRMDVVIVKTNCEF